MEGDGGESGRSLQSLLLLSSLLKSIGAAAAHIEVHEVQESFDSEGVVVSHFEIDGVLFPV